MNGGKRMSIQGNNKKLLIKECNEDIQKLYYDIEVLQSIIESKRQDITDLMKVVEALEKLNENYMS